MYYRCILHLAVVLRYPSRSRLRFCWRMIRHVRPMYQCNARRMVTRKWRSPRKKNGAKNRSARSMWRKPPRRRQQKSRRRNVAACYGDQCSSGRLLFLVINFSASYDFQACINSASIVLRRETRNSDTGCSLIRCSRNGLLRARLMNGHEDIVLVSLKIWQPINPITK